MMMDADEIARRFRGPYRSSRARQGTIEWRFYTRGRRWVYPKEVLDLVFDLGSRQFSAEYYRQESKKSLWENPVSIDPAPLRSRLDTNQLAAAMRAAITFTPQS